MRRFYARAVVAAVYFFVLSAVARPAVSQQSTGESTQDKGVCVWVNSHWICS